MFLYVLHIGKSFCRWFCDVLQFYQSFSSLTRKQDCKFLNPAYKWSSNWEICRFYWLNFHAWDIQKLIFFLFDTAVMMTGETLFIYFSHGERLMKERGQEDNFVYLSAQLEMINVFWCVPVIETWLSCIHCFRNLSGLPLKLKTWYWEILNVLCFQSFRRTCSFVLLVLLQNPSDNQWIILNSSCVISGVLHSYCTGEIHHGGAKLWINGLFFPLKPRWKVLPGQSSPFGMCRCAVRLWQGCQPWWWQNTRAGWHWKLLAWTWGFGSVNHEA